MTKDDYPVIAYKIMAYYYACLREGTEGNVIKAQELTGCNDVYFRSVIDDLINNGYMAGSITLDFAQEITGSNLRITLKGTEYLQDNSTMTKVKKALGKSFEVILQAAVTATSLL